MLEWLFGLSSHLKACRGIQAEQFERDRYGKHSPVHSAGGDDNVAVNGLDGVLLRALEYFNGLRFLTLNRVGSATSPTNL